jgi:fermentation-respiration switch protein FrsA (DUF1100 family)
MSIVRIRNENGLLAAYVKRSVKAPIGTLVCVHGGPDGDHSGNDKVFDQIAEYCPSLGFSILQFDMFGAGASEGGPADITLESQLRDYRAAFEYALRELGGPVHVVGESMGATVAALDWALPAASFLLLWPAFDLRDTDLRPYLSPRWLSSAEEDGYIDDDGTVLGLEFLTELGSFDFSRCFRLPDRSCLLVHGKGDTAVPFEQSLEAVRQSIGECVLFAHPTGDHGLQAEEERRFTHGAIQWWLGERAH